MLFQLLNGNVHIYSVTGHNQRFVLLNAEKRLLKANEILRIADEWFDQCVLDCQRCPVCLSRQNLYCPVHPLFQIVALGIRPRIVLVGRKEEVDKESVLFWVFRRHFNYTYSYANGG